MNADEIRRELRRLRAGLHQGDVGPQAQISRFERGLELHLLPRHALHLVGHLGPGIWLLAAEASLLALGDANDAEGLRPVAEAIAGALAEWTEERLDVTGPEGRPSWVLRRPPSLEDIGRHMGHPELDALQIEGLRNAVMLTGFFRGWPEQPMSQQEKRSRIRHLEAELDRLRE